MSAAGQALLKVQSVRHEICKVQTNINFPKKLASPLVREVQCSADRGYTDKNSQEKHERTIFVILQNSSNLSNL